MYRDRIIKILIALGAVGVTLALAWVYVNLGIKILVPGLVGLGALVFVLFFRDVKTPFFYLLVVFLPIFIARYMAPIPEAEHPGVLNVPVLYSYELPLYLFLLLWLLEFISGRGANLYLPRTTTPLALLFVPAIISTFTALDYTFGLYELLRMFEMFLVFIVVVNYLKTDRQLKIVFVVLGAGIIFQSLLAVAQFIAPYKMYDLLAKFGIYMGISHARPYDPTSPIRACGTTGYCNSLAGFFELVVPLFASLFFFYPMSRNWRRLTVGVIILALAALLLTYSRGGLLGIVVGTGALLFLAARRFPALRKNAIKLTLIVGAQLAIVLAVFSERLLMRLQFFMSSSMEDEVRVALIRDALFMIKSHPFVGVGLNNYPEAFPLYEITGVKFELLYPVHNTWLLITAEQGFLGLAAFLLLMFFIFADARRAIKEPTPLHAAAGLGLTAGLIGWYTHNLVAPLYQNWLVNRITFVFIVGVLAVIPRLLGSGVGESSADVLAADPRERP